MSSTDAGRALPGRAPAAGRRLPRPGCASPPSRAPTRLEEAMRYSLLAGGKRIRPVLALATAEALGRDRRARCCRSRRRIEMIHTYSLIHDDLPAMDDDELRRGKPTCHVAYGEDVAILAGDGLFAEALRLVLAEQEGEPAARARRGARARDRRGGVGGMVGGQYLDVTARRPGRPTCAACTSSRPGALIAASVGCVLALVRCRRTCHNPLPPLCGGARRPVPDRRRHPRRDRRRGRARQAAAARTSATASAPT